MLGKIWKKKTNTDTNTNSVVTAGGTDVLDSRLSEHELTYRELRAGETRRMSIIHNEFKHTFNFLKNYPRTVSFFGSARFHEDSVYYAKARELAKKIVEETGYTVVTGGGPGIMEAANRGAYEAGGKSLGMNIILPHEQKINDYLTAHIQFHYFFTRKVALSFSAEVYIYFPGGFGTLDEFFEVLTLVQTNKIPKIPLICFGKEYWNNVLKLATVLRDEFKTINPGDESLFLITDDIDEIVKIVKKVPLRKE